MDRLGSIGDNHAEHMGGLFSRWSRNSQPERLQFSDKDGVLIVKGSNERYIFWIKH